MWKAALLLALPCAAAASAQEEEVEPFEPPPVRWPAVPATAETAEGFVAPGWAIQVRRSGDLDGDGRADLAMVVQQRSAANVGRPDGFSPELDANPRMLLVALAGGEGRPYRLALANRTLIPRHDEVRNEDPFGPEHGGLEVRRGAFAVTVGLFANMGTWTSYRRTFTFRLRDGRALLIGVDEHRFQRNSGETIRTSVNYPARRKEVRTSAYEADEPPTVERTRSRSGPLRTIEQVGDAMQFDIEGA